MYKLVIVLTLFCSLAAGAQEREVVTMDIVKVKDGRMEEALYYYQHNWKLYRDSALKAGKIKSYQLLKSDADTAGTSLVLVTVYHSRRAYDAREAVFQPIIKALRPNGPVFLNQLKRDKFLSATHSMVTEAVY